MNSAATLLIPKDGEKEGKTSQKQKNRNVLNHREYITPQKPSKELYPDMHVWEFYPGQTSTGTWDVLLFRHHYWINKN